jgi:hypothetical protein
MNIVRFLSQFKRYRVHPQAGIGTPGFSPWSPCAFQFHTVRPPVFVKNISSFIFANYYLTATRLINSLSINYRYYSGTPAHTITVKRFVGLRKHMQTASRLTMTNLPPFFHPAGPTVTIASPGIFNHTSAVNTGIISGGPTINKTDNRKNRPFFNFRRCMEQFSVFRKHHRLTLCNGNLYRIRQGNGFSYNNFVSLKPSPDHSVLGLVRLAFYPLRPLYRYAHKGFHPSGESKRYAYVNNSKPSLQINGVIASSTQHHGAPTMHVNRTYRSFPAVVTGGNRSPRTANRHPGYGLRETETGQPRHINSDRPHDRQFTAPTVSNTYGMHIVHKTVSGNAMQPMLETMGKKLNAKITKDMDHAVQKSISVEINRRLSETSVYTRQLRQSIFNELRQSIVFEKERRGVFQ